MSEWLEVAKQLPLGHKRRMRHDCSESRDLLVSHGEQGYSAYCFRCGNVGFEKHGHRNLAELAEIRALNSQALEVQTHELPQDFSPDIPSEQGVWLFKAGISVRRAASLGMGWSDKLQRIIMPLYGSDGTLLYWQGRAVHKYQAQKYINPPVPKADLLYWVHPDSGPTATVCVTEDILSAIRIGKHTSAASILGTKTSDQQAAQLMEYDTVAYWLDPDAAGHEGNIKGTRKLALATATRIITSEADPKNLSDRVIRDTLGLTPNHRYDYYDYNHNNRQP